MTRDFGRYLHLLWQSVIFWSFALTLFAILRYYGADGGSGALQPLEIKEKNTILPQLSVLISIGVILGVLFALIEWYFENSHPRKMILGLNLLLKTIAYFICSIIIFTIVLKIASGMLPYDFNLARGWWITNKTVWVLLFYIFLGSLVFSFLKIAGNRFGKNMFLKTLIGTFKTPHEEKRIFMFVDLKDSTRLAERLGHFLYSQLIQDCFSDLNNVAPKYDAEIYQYVGDEAVLSWPYKRGIKNNNCVAFFLEFEQQLLSRKHHYQTKYGSLPVFKAGAHGGKLIVVEVGHEKKELAYHGDVINTAARIQQQCNSNNSTFLVSEELINALEHKVKAKRINNHVELKGKQEIVVLYTIKNN